MFKNCCVKVHTECIKRLLKEGDSKEYEQMDLEADVLKL